MKFNEPNKYGYIEPVIKEGDAIHGDGRLGDVATNPSGDWTPWLPEPELQNRGYETYACVSEAWIHVNEILNRFKFGDKSKLSVRFLATVSGTGPKKGNDNGTVTDKFERGGCVLESDWPFDAASYDAFYTMPPANILQLAKAQMVDKSPGSSWIKDTSPAAMMEALMFSPLSMAVFAWAPPDANGIYHRPPGAKDCHEVVVFSKLEKQYWLIFDTYDKVIKKLAWDYGFGIGKRGTLDKKFATTPNPNGWLNLKLFLQYVRHLLGLEGATFGSVRSSQWEAMSRAYRKEQPLCEFGMHKPTLLSPLNTHHVEAFHNNPSLELVKSNWINLCRFHHLWNGHLGNWKSENVNVRTEAAAFTEEVKNRP